MYANIMISVSRSVWQILSPDARADLQSLLNEFITTVSEEIERWDGPSIVDTDEVITFSASAFNEDEDEQEAAL